MAQKLTTEQFIEKARAVHGPLYDYSRVEYRSRKNKVIIICPTHGLIEQTANDHLSGYGCKACGRLRTSAAQTIGQQGFLEKARAIHGERYDYSQVVYQGAHAKVKILCLQHGAFQQSPTSHLHGGAGCPGCGGVARLNTKTFLERARAVHGDRYDYSRSECINQYKKILITCATHGEFKQSAKHHLLGMGCNKCGEALTGRKNAANPNVAASARLSWLEQIKGRPASLYFLRLFNENESFYKVGITLHTVKQRFRELTKEAGYSYEILALHTSANAAAVYDWEQSILGTFAHLRYTPKRPFGGASECFSSCDEILAIFPL